jgi:hypothetical protein
MSEPTIGGNTLAEYEALFKYLEDNTPKGAKAMTDDTLTRDDLLTELQRYKCAHYSDARLKSRQKILDAFDAQQAQIDSLKLTEGIADRAATIVERLNCELRADNTALREAGEYLCAAAENKGVDARWSREFRAVLARTGTEGSKSDE